MPDETPTPDPTSKMAGHPASSYGGLNFPSVESPLHHRGSGWQGMSWGEFMDDTAWQAIHFLRTESATQQRDVPGSIPFRIADP